MTSTAQLNKQQEKTGTWSNVFPTEQVTEQQSALFIKKLLAVAVSNITYLRAIFPEGAFGDRCLEDLNLKILRDDSTCPGACQVIRWVKGCFDALEKKYLKMLIIGIYTDRNDPETVIESYTFKFSYTDENPAVDIYRNNKKISSAHTASDTKKATIILLRTIVVLTQSLSSLPDDVMMTMKLLYYDEVTPSDYEPPGFTAADCDVFKFEEEPMNIKVGDVSTPFHTVKLRIKTDKNQFELQENMGTMDTEESVCDLLNDDNETSIMKPSSESVDKEEVMETESGQESKDFSESKSHKTRKRKQGGDNSIKEPTEADDVPSHTPIKPGMNEQAVATTGSQSASVKDSQQQEEDMGVRCPCGCNEDDGLMILCASCKYWQHGVCFKILTENEAPEKHICEKCSETDDPELKATDPHLQGLNEVAVRATCLWRRALVACSDLSRVLGPSFSRRMGVEITVAQGLINRLEKEGYIKAPTKGKRLGKVVDKEKLVNEGLKKYFKKISPEEEQVQDEDKVEPMREILVEVKNKESNMQEEMEKLAAQTDNMSVSGKRKRKIRDSQHSGTVTVKVHDPVDNESTNHKSHKQKRVKAINNAENEFELCGSQDLSDDEDGAGSRKKRKASRAKKPIMV